MLNKKIWYRSIDCSIDCRASLQQGHYFKAKTCRLQNRTTNKRF